jgi:hypothetical protein
MPQDKPSSPSSSRHVLYGVAIHQSIATGDLAMMKAVAAQAQQYLADHGDVSAALEGLKIEIAKLEGGKP